MVVLMPSTLATSSSWRILRRQVLHGDMSIVESHAGFRAFLGCLQTAVIFGGDDLQLHPRRGGQVRGLLPGFGLSFAVGIGFVFARETDHAVGHEFRRDGARNFRQTAGFSAVGRFQADDDREGSEMPASLS